VIGTGGTEMVVMRKEIIIGVLEIIKVIDHPITRTPEDIEMTLLEGIALESLIRMTQRN
jgi:hypothetical protein